MKRFTTQLGLFLLLVAGVFAWYLSSFNALPVAARRASEFKVGMSMNAVKDIAGEPKSTGLDGREWTYSVKYAWPIFHMSFDGEDKLVEWELDY